MTPNRRIFLTGTLAVLSALVFATGASGQQRLLVFGGRDHKVFLGCLCGEFDSESIFNEFSDFGSKFSSTSIWNHFSDYGSKFSDYSACNAFASNPPIVVTADGRSIGRLTLNAMASGALTEPKIVGWLKSVCDS
jgi:hypothetical protein